MIKCFDPSTFFVTFTFLEKLWKPSIKALYTLHAKKLNLLNKIKHLQSIHITILKHTNQPITYARYYDYQTFYLPTF
jgi:hypothetical protein